MRRYSNYIIFAVFLLFFMSIARPGGVSAGAEAPAPVPDAAAGRAAAVTVVLDPGHGGEDTGAIGPGGVEEKKVTLSVAKRLAEILRARPGMRVLLTREDDTFIPLRERTAFANANNADVFVSIHANSAGRKGASGVETYFLSYEATDDEARKLAAIENSLRPFAGAERPEMTDDLQEILGDLAAAIAHHESSALAESIQASMVAATGSEDRGVKQAPFAVLVGAAMPAALVEVGFISNPGEKKRLTSVKDQARIADSIAQGIMAFRKTVSGGRDEQRQASRKAR